MTGNCGPVMTENDHPPGPDPRSADPADPDPAREEPIFGAILWVLVASVIAGVALALIGEMVLGSEPVRNTGTGVGVVSGAIYFAFRWLGRREARRRDRGRAPDR